MSMMISKARSYEGGQRLLLTLFDILKAKTYAGGGLIAEHLGIKAESAK